MNSASISTGNILHETDTLVATSKLQNKEIFSTILEQGNIKIERIISTGQSTPMNETYDQELDEFVFLSQGNAKLWIQSSDSKEQVVEMQQGDYILIPKHTKHRVVYTSNTPPCIWLCFFFDANASHSSLANTTVDLPVQNT